ncbi:MAG TPA: hypothetical protein VF939_03475 [Puia sp.]
MIIGHPSEIELQLYVLDEPGCTTEVMEHIGQCEDCQVSASAYRLAFAEIKQQSRPAFDFKIEELILPSISPIRTPNPAAARKEIFMYILVFGAFAFIGLPFYLYRGYLSKMFAGMLPVAICLMAMTAMIILIFYGMEMYRKYRKQLKSLNYY